MEELHKENNNLNLKKNEKIFFENNFKSNPNNFKCFEGKIFPLGFYSKGDDDNPNKDIQKANKINIDRKKTFGGKLKSKYILAHIFSLAGRYINYLLPLSGTMEYQNGNIFEGSFIRKENKDKNEHDGDLLGTLKIKVNNDKINSLYKEYTGYFYTKKINGEIIQFIKKERNGIKPTFKDIYKEKETILNLKEDIPIFNITQNKEITEDEMNKLIKREEKLQFKLKYEKKEKQQKVDQELKKRILKI